MISSVVHPVVSLQKKASYDPTNLLGLGEQPLEVGLLEVADVERHIELRARLCTRTLCCGKELMKLASTAAFETLSNM
jgi:hypothetical protein